MLICYVHGFNSAFTTENDKVKALAAAFPTDDVVGLEYNLEKPDPLKQLRDNLDEYLSYGDHDSVLLVGSSLGGFLVDKLAKITGFNSILINPLIVPDTFLSREIGPHVNLTNYKRWNFTNAAFNELKALGQNIWPFEKEALRLVLLDKGDEVLPFDIARDHFANKAKVVIFEGGNHRFAHIAEAMTEIKKHALTVVQITP